MASKHWRLHIFNSIPALCPSSWFVNHLVHRHWAESQCWGVWQHFTDSVLFTFTDLLCHQLLDFWLILFVFWILELIIENCIYSLLVKFIKHNQNYYLKLDVLTSIRGLHPKTLVLSSYGFNTMGRCGRMRDSVGSCPHIRSGTRLPVTISRFAVKKNRKWWLEAIDLQETYPHWSVSEL